MKPQAIHSVTLHYSRAKMNPDVCFSVELIVRRTEDGWTADYACRNAGARTGRKNTSFVVPLPHTWTADMDALAQRTVLTAGETRPPWLGPFSQPAVAFNGGKPEALPNNPDDWRELEDAVRALQDESRRAPMRFVIRTLQYDYSMALSLDHAKREASLWSRIGDRQGRVERLELSAYKKLRMAVLKTQEVSLAKPKNDPPAPTGIRGGEMILLDRGDGALLPVYRIRHNPRETGEDVFAVAQSLGIAGLDAWAKLAKS